MINKTTRIGAFIAIYLALYLASSYMDLETTSFGLQYVDGTEMNVFVMTCAGYIAHPSEYLGNGDAMSLKIGYYAGQS